MLVADDLVVHKMAADDLVVHKMAADDLVPEGLDDVCETSLVVVENAENECLTMILVVVAW